MKLITQAMPERDARVLVVPVSINLGTLPYFDGVVSLASGDEETTLRRVRFHRDHIVDGFPLLFCAARPFDASEMNLFMEHRYRGKFRRPKNGGHRNDLGGVTVKTVKSIANSLRVFLAWLVATKTDWREIYAVADTDRAKAWLPPYRYRAFLISRIEAKEISRDTANLYINHLRQFYEWALAMRRIERVPFQYNWITIKKQRKDGDFDVLFSSIQDEKGISIQTTDLIIPKKYKNRKAALDDDLAPYSADELRWFFDSHYMRTETRKRCADLAVVCGLRAEEVATFPESAVEDPSICGKSLFTVKILGKFNKERKILIPRFLMEELWAYKNSFDRLHRAGKWDLRKGTGAVRPLFLNRSGGSMSGEYLTNFTSFVKAELSEKGVSFERSFHDLRATFATTLARFMLGKGLPLGFIQYKLMSLMGHANFSTTQKYINFAGSVTFESQMQDWVDRVFSDLRPSLETEAKSTETFE